MTLSTTGRIIRILPTIVRKSRTTGKTIYMRKFWISAKGSDFGSKLPVQTVEMNIVTPEENPNPNFATCEDLDKLSIGNVVRFTFGIMSVFSKDKRNGEERCFTNLTVSSRFDLMGMNSPYSKAKLEEYEKRQEEHDRISEAAMRDYANNVVGTDPVSGIPQ